MERTKTVNIGKNTFLVSFIIGNIFMFGAVIAALTPTLREYGEYFIVGGYYYLFIASVVNIFILIALSGYCYWIKEKWKNYFKAIGFILLNIPIAAFYAYIGLEYVINL
jgi:LIVCS family branched-chain amino acid:cation transporter